MTGKRLIGDYWKRVMVSTPRASRDSTKGASGSPPSAAASPLSLPQRERAPLDNESPLSKATEKRSVIDADLRSGFWGKSDAIYPAKSLQFVDGGGGGRTKNEPFVRKRSWRIFECFWNKPITTALSVRRANRKNCSAITWRGGLV